MQGLSEAQGKGWAYDLFGIIIKYIIDHGFSLLRSDLRSSVLCWSLSSSICSVTFHMFFSIKHLSGLCFFCRRPLLSHRGWRSVGQASYHNSSPKINLSPSEELMAQLYNVPSILHSCQFWKDMKELSTFEACMRKVSGQLSKRFLLLAARKKSSMSYSTHKIILWRKVVLIFFFCGRILTIF